MSTPLQPQYPNQKWQEMCRLQRVESSWAIDIVAVAWHRQITTPGGASTASRRRDPNCVRRGTPRFLLLKTGRHRRSGGSEHQARSATKVFAARRGGLQVPDLIDLVGDPVTHP